MLTTAYGTWRSPITPRSVAASALRLGSVAIDDEDIYWIEGRPEEGGRNALVKRSANGQIADVTPAGSNVRTRVHEYGGAAYTVSRGVVYYAEFSDQRLYRLEPGGTPEPLTAGRVVLRGWLSRPLAPAARLRTRGPHSERTRGRDDPRQRAARRSGQRR